MTNGVNQLRVAVVPGMAVGVVGRRAERAVRVLYFPVGFTFEVRAMTFGAMKGVDLRATGDLLRWSRTGGPSAAAVGAGAVALLARQPVTSNKAVQINK